MTTTRLGVCNLCEAICGLELEIEGARILSIRGDADDPFSRGHICPKAVALQDIQNALSPSDAMALEGLFTRLQESGESFCMQVRTASRSRTLKLCASRGRDREGLVTFHILWLEDITTAANDLRRNDDLKNAAESETSKLQTALDASNDGDMIKMAGGTYSGVSIGPVCRVRGEVEESVVLGYSNKAHDGFLGHA